MVDAHHPDGHHVADAHHVVRALDVAVGELADVDQARVLQADVDERAEVDDVEHRPLQLHAGLEVLELEDALLEDRLGQVVARVAVGPGQGVEDVAQGRLADLQLARQRREVGLVELGVQRGELLLVADDVGGEPELLEQLGRRPA